MTGKMPYDGIVHDPKVITKIISHEKPAAIHCPEIPAALGECIDNCWEIEPVKRKPVSEHLKTVTALLAVS